MNGDFFLKMIYNYITPLTSQSFQRILSMITQTNFSSLAASSMKLIYLGICGPRWSTSEIMYIRDIYYRQGIGRCVHAYAFHIPTANQWIIHPLGSDLLDKGTLYMDEQLDQAFTRIGKGGTLILGSQLQCPQDNSWYGIFCQDRISYPPEIYQSSNRYITSIKDADIILKAMDYHM